MDGLISFGNKRSYEDFRKQISPQVQPLFDSLREFCFSLGDKVVEDVRMHRVVYGKSLTFRWFSDFEPEQESILIKIQRSRKEPTKTIRIKENENSDELQKLLRDAFETIC